LGIVEADHEFAADHPDGRWDRAVVAYRRFDLTGDPQIVGTGQTVRDDRALTGDHGTAGA
jgi:hypothetical protein